MGSGQSETRAQNDLSQLIQGRTGTPRHTLPSPLAALVGYEAATRKLRSEWTSKKSYGDTTRPECDRIAPGRGRKATAHAA